jgi:putative FmdB family regulatory protein
MGTVFPSIMPTYEYSCEKCHKTFDVFQSMKDPVFKTCPKEACRMKKWGKGKIRRLLGTGAGLIFKGSGFYTTDYRSHGYKEAAKKDTPAPAAVKTDPPKTDTSKNATSKAKKD